MTPRARDALLVLIMGLAVAHVAVLGWWVVDDAAISFAYARNLAQGWGLTPYVGGEQVEGYSNPTWVLLLAVGQVFGVSPFVAAKLLSFGLVAGTVPLVDALARRVDRAAGLPAAVLFAANTQVALFGAAGLENPLLGFLLALGLWLVAREIDSPRGFPWSAVVFAVLGASRPEGLIYAAAVAPWVLRGGAGLRWIAVVGVLSGGVQLARWSWFGWPFPMTYYAKVRSGPEALVRWLGAGWVYLRGFALSPERVWTVPFVVAGLVPGWQRVLAVVTAVVALGLAPSLIRWLGPPAAIGLLGLAAGLLVPVARQDGWAVRGPAWTTTIAAAVFALQAGGDWMSGYRWLAITAVPLAVLGSLGLVALARQLPRQVGVGMATLAVLVFAAGNVAVTVGFRADPETSAFMVGGRVKGTRELLAKLHVEERPVTMTFDLGGFLWWSGMEIVDAMGLVDVPVALNKDRGTVFWDEYVEERRPHLLYRVGPRAGADLAAGQVLGTQYLEAGTTTRVRRDLVFEPAWSGPPDVPIAADGVVVVGLEVRQPRVAAGDPVRVDVGLQSTDGRAFTSELVLADDDGNLLWSWPIEPAYGLLAPASWRPGDVFHGRFTLGLPKALSNGSYPLGVRIDGEVSWSGDRLDVVDPAAARAADVAARTAALALATSGRCEEADRVGPWDEEGLRVRAACWRDRTDGDPIVRLAHARRLDPALPGLDAVVRPLADQRFADGLRARATGDAEGAFRAFSDVLRLDPARSHARWYAEEARALRLH